LFEAIRSLGIPIFENQNGRIMEADGGASVADMCIRDGKRQSVFRAYVFPHMNEPNLKVYGVDNLRIADGSIKPRVTTGNTMAPCVIVGERAAEIIRDEHQIGTVSVSRSDRF
jgi:choline dehydrogenase-like flavoprotein